LAEDLPDVFKDNPWLEVLSSRGKDEAKYECNTVCNTPKASAKSREKKVHVREDEGNGNGVVIVSIRLSKKANTILEQIAEKLGATKADLIREGIRAVIKEYREFTAT